MMEDENRENQFQNQEYIKQLEHETILKQQQIESLDKYLAETKESLTNIQSMNSNAIEQQIDKFNDERKEQLARLEKISLENTRKERQITTLENQLEASKSQGISKDKSMIDARNEL